MTVSSFHSHKQQHLLQRVIDGTFRKSSITKHYGYCSSNWSMTSNTCTRNMCYRWLENILLGAGDTCCEQFHIWNHWKCLHCEKNFEPEINEVPTLKKKLLQLLSGELWNTNAMSCSRPTTRNEISWINSFIFLLKKIKVTVQNMCSLQWSEDQGMTEEDTLLLQTYPYHPCYKSTTLIISKNELHTRCVTAWVNTKNGHHSIITAFHLHFAGLSISGRKHLKLQLLRNKLKPSRKISHPADFLTCWLWAYTLTI